MKMNLTFLGLGAAFFPALRNTCAYYKEGDQVYLLDCGATAFVQLMKDKVLDGVRKVTCFISHRHPDHTGSLGTLAAYGTYVGHFDVVIVHPDEAIAKLLTYAAVTEQEYQFVQTDHYQDERLDVQFHPVQHTPGLPAWGFTLTMDGETIYYSGDGEMPPKAVWDDFCAGKIARLYQDAGRTAHGGHGDFEALKAMCPLELRSRLYPIHLNCDYRDEIVAEGFGVADFTE